MSLNKKVIIVAQALDNLFQYKNKDYDFIGVESGAKYLIEEKYSNLVHFVCDGDNLQKDQSLFIQKNFKSFEIHNREKDTTDVELAILWAIKEGYQEILIFQKGARQDHFFCNLLILKKYALLHQSIKFYLFDNKNKISFLLSGKYKVFPELNRYISFFSFDECLVSTEFLKWNLDHAVISSNSTYTISNKLVENHKFFKIEIQGENTGLFLFESKD